ncbi:MAG: hypothetical protein ACE5GM_09455, partial [bacterium]
GNLIPKLMKPLAVVEKFNRLGFRCGVCYEFPAFNLQTGKQLKLRERPLIVMEATFIDYSRLELDDPGLLETVLAYKDRCRMFQGDFTLLWHNNRLDSPAAVRLYQKIIAA